MATYGSEAGVEAINAHFIGGYTSATQPTSTQVATFLSDGYAALNLRLSLAGYSMPATSGTAYDVLARLNNLYAAACAEEAVNLSTAGMAEESRSQRLWGRYDAELGALLAGDLTLAGLTMASTAKPRRGIRSLAMRKRDGYAEHFDNDNTEYGSASDDDWTLLYPWNLGGGQRPQGEF
jgi:hypothetical protein